MLCHKAVTDKKNCAHISICLMLKYKCNFKYNFFNTFKKYNFKNNSRFWYYYRDTIFLRRWKKACVIIRHSSSPINSHRSKTSTCHIPPDETMSQAASNFHGTHGKKSETEKEKVKERQTDSETKKSQCLVGVRLRLLITILDVVMPSSGSPFPSWKRSRFGVVSKDTRSV